jgi:hypothetical protein
MSKSFNYTLIANIILIIFPILFAITVCNSVYKEEKGFQAIYTEDAVTDEGCDGVMLINISFAILLGAIWNGTKIIKIGAI